MLFAAFAFVVLLGTVFPLLVEALNDDRISVGAPYFDRMTMPIGLTLLFLMAVAPVLPWRKASRRAAAPPAAVAGVDRRRRLVVLAVVLGARGLAPLVAFGLGGFAAGSAVRQIVLATRRQGWRGFVGRANGGMVVHLGVVHHRRRAGRQRELRAPGRVHPRARARRPSSPATPSPT